MPGLSQRAYRFDDCLLDIGGFQVWKAGSLAPLEPKSIRVLHYLVENRGRLVGKDELIQAVWGETFVTDNALTRVIAQLRKALGDSAKQARYIETVPTQGYRFIAAVEEVEAPPAPIAVTEPVVASEPVPGSAWRKAVAGIGLCGALVAIAWMWRERDATAGAARKMDGGDSVQFTTSGGLDATPAFAPDGNSIAYASDKSGTFEIYVRPLAAGGREVQVTRDGGQNVQPSWSPDGSRIAYYSAKKGGICVMPALGGFPKLVTKFGADPKWSPDGKWIAFRSGGFVSLVPPDIFPPYGSKLWIVSAEGGQPRQLTDWKKPDGAHGAPSWSPDSRKLLFSAFSSGDIAMWTVDIDGGRIERLPGARPSIAPHYSPDGKWIYSACRTRENSFGLCRTNAATGESTEIQWTGMSAPRDLSVSRDGRSLAYTVTTMTSNLWSLPVTADGQVQGEASQLMQDTSVRNTLPAISPDGRRVAYHARRRGAQGDIFVQNPDGTSEQVTNHPAADIMPSWTPDGKAIVYSSTRNRGNELWRVSLTDGTETRLLGSPHLMAMAKLSPDGRWALFHRYDNYLLGTWRALIQTGEATRLTPESESMGYPCWSRDGKWVAVERKYGDWTETGVVPAGGGAYRALTKEQGQNWPHSWSPDSTKVAMAALRDGTWNLWWVGLDGKERRLTDYRSLRTYVRYPEWSPTGERIVFEFAEAKGNVYLMNLD